MTDSQGAGLAQDRRSSPERWYWKAGRLTNLDHGPRAFPCLHLMRWHSARWRHDGTEAPWSRLDPIVQTDWRLAGRQGFEISPEGIRGIAPGRDVGAGGQDADMDIRP